jgi:rsbT co-antagonist protein RsbR
MQDSDSPRSSSADLRARIAELEAENAALRRSRALLQGIADHAPAVVYIKDRRGRFVHSNGLHAQLLGLLPTEVVGKREADLLPPESAAEIDRVAAEIFASGASRSTVFELELEGGPRVFLELMFPIRDERGEIIALGGIANDITENRRAEEKNAALQAEVIEAQRRVIRELAAPLLPLAEGVVVLPLVGTILIDRAEQIARLVLERVHATRIHTVLFDVSGMPDCDDAAVVEFAGLLRSLRLLGAKTVLTGIGPALAKRLLPGADMLREVEIVSTVQIAIARILQTTRPRT